MLGFIKIGEINNERYYQLAKGLFKNSNYKGMSLAAKVLYALLRDRIELSLRNRWSDKNGDAYIFFTIDDIVKTLEISNKTAVKCMKELIKFGLVESKRQGLGKPNKLYISHIKPQTCDDIEHASGHSDLQKFTEEQKGTSRSVENTLQEMYKVQSRNVQSTLPKMYKVQANETDKKETNITEEREKTTPSTKKEKVFEKPTLEEVKAYAKERGYRLYPDRFFEYYETTGWTDRDGRPIKNWKNKMAVWEMYEKEKTIHSPTEVKGQYAGGFRLATAEEWKKVKGWNLP